MTKTDISEIVLYHGSLAELNLRDLNRPYKFADEHSILLRVGTGSIPDSGIEHFESRVKKHLAERNYDGIVNRRTVVFNPLEHKGSYIEGTPVIRVDTRSK